MTWSNRVFSDQIPAITVLDAITSSEHTLVDLSKLNHRRLMQRRFALGQICITRGVNDRMAVDTPFPCSMENFGKKIKGRCL